MADSDTNYETPRVFHTVAPERVYSGTQCINNLPAFLNRKQATRVLLATSNSIVSNTGFIDTLSSLAADRPVEVFAGCRQHSPEQDILDVMQAVADHQADVVVSVGGSSVFDTVKVALSRLRPDPNDTLVPQIAVPTTLSAGEFTAGAGYTPADKQSKQLVLDLRASPAAVFLDPGFTLATPDELWLGSGFKALDHAMEAVWSLTPHPYVDALALEAIRVLFHHLPLSVSGPSLQHRGACQQAAWMSIAGVGGAGMRLSHFLGHQIGAAMHIPHGITSCVLLPGVMRYLAPKTLNAQVRIARAMGLDTSSGSDAEIAAAAADRLEQTIRGLGLPTRIAEAGGQRQALEAAIQASGAAAVKLRLTEDLPRGEESVRQLLESVW